MEISDRYGGETDLLEEFDKDELDELSKNTNDLISDLVELKKYVIA